MVRALRDMAPLSETAGESAQGKFLAWTSEKLNIADGKFWNEDALTNMPPECRQLFYGLVPESILKLEAKPIPPVIVPIPGAAGAPDLNAVQQMRGADEIQYQRRQTPKIGGRARLRMRTSGRSCLPFW